MPTAYFSEVLYSGSIAADFIEVAVSTGTDVTGWTIQLYSTAGQNIVTMNFPAPTTTLVGRDIYMIEQGVPSFPNLSANMSLAIVDGTGTVLQFATFYDGAVTAIDGDAAGMTPTFVGVTAASGESVQSDDGGATYYVQTAPNGGTIPCFAPGARVECLGGERLVEELRPKDIVLTRDHGPQPIRWVSAVEQEFTRADFTDRPVLIPAGVLGASRDLIVSPQHHIMLQGVADPLSPSLPGVLVPAKSLVGQSGIRFMRGKKQITWHHFALDRHELVRVNGVWTESLLVGEMVLNGLLRRESLSLQRMYPPGMETGLNGPPARLCLSVGASKSMLETGLLGVPKKARCGTQPKEGRPKAKGRAIGTPLA